MSAASSSRHDPSSAAVRPTWPVEVDLHLHTTASDGVLSPSELIQLVSRTSLRAISITDHDTTSGLVEAREAVDLVEGLTLIPGVELSTHGRVSEIHLTCHFIDVSNEALQSTMRELVEDREVRARRMIDRLDEIGLPVSWDDVSRRADGTIGRPHIARAMIDAGYVASIAEAFDRYLASGRPAHVPRMKLDVFKAIRLVHASGGVTTVAHPRTVDRLDEMIGDLVDAGLTGIEVYAEKYGADEVTKYDEMAGRYGLLRSGGTDYHANGIPNEVLPGMNGPPPETARLLYERALEMHGESGVGARFDLDALSVGRNE